MPSRFIFHFDWDPVKAALNRRKHGIGFTEAMAVFSDPRSLTRYNDEHSEIEERWITIGMTEAGALAVVIHTFKEHKVNEARIRIISARSATARERRQYEDNRYSVHEDKPMKDEYDFSNAERGKFFRKAAVFEMPIYLEPEVLAYFTARAKEKGLTVDELLNEVLKQDIERMKAGG